MSERVKGTWVKAMFTDGEYAIAMPNKTSVETIVEALDNIDGNKLVVGRHTLEVEGIYRGASKEAVVTGSLVIKRDITKGKESDFLAQTISESQMWNKAVEIVGFERACDVLARPYRIARNMARGGRETTKQGERITGYSVIVSERLYEIGEHSRREFTARQQVIIDELEIGDLHANNIGIDKNGVLKILDYGL